MLQTACMGLAMGASYLLVGRNLWVTVLAHMVMDTLLLVPMYLGQGTAG
jgi:membrane protease YdiL (CAAX protease family)